MHRLIDVYGISIVQGHSMRSCFEVSRAKLTRVYLLTIREQAIEIQRFPNHFLFIFALLAEVDEEMIRWISCMCSARDFLILVMFRVSAFSSHPF